MIQLGSYLYLQMLLKTNGHEQRYSARYLYITRVMIWFELCSE